MNDLFLHIKYISDGIFQNYGLSLQTFVIIYLLSSLPFYFGYFLMVHGSVRNLVWRDFFSLKILKDGLSWNVQIITGFLIHLLGRIMPYVYILVKGRNLNLYLVVFVWIIILALILSGLSKFLFKKINQLSVAIKIEKKNKILNLDEINILWQIYNFTFEELNRISPCKQSFDREHFIEALKDDSILKYLVYAEEDRCIGLALVTNNFKNTPWISEDYFKFNYPTYYSTSTLYYFLGIAIEKNYRGNRYSIKLIERIIDDLPSNILMGFDHSININPRLHLFTCVIKQSHLIRRTPIDRQHYHVVEYKR